MSARLRLLILILAAGLLLSACGPKAQLYILNKSSRRFHLPECRYAQDIKPKNRLEVTDTRLNVIEMGYAPCQNCKP